MNNIFDIINVPLGLVMQFLYYISGNYAITLALFALVIKIVLFPLGIKQQQGQIKMSAMRPKENAIRKKYAGRTDKATQEKLNAEIMELYKVEKYSPMSGCLPLLIQLPVIFALYNIVRNPLTYIARFPAELLTRVKQIAVYFAGNPSYQEYTSDALEKLATSGINVASADALKDINAVQEIDLIALLTNKFDDVKNAVTGGIQGVLEPLTGIDDISAIIDKGQINFDFFGQSLTVSPISAGLSVLIAIPLINFVTGILQTRLTKILNKGTAIGEASAGNSMKIMEWTMPLLIVYTAFTFQAALGLYWIFQAVFGIAQMLVLAKVMPLPKITEEDIKAAEAKYGGAAPKKKKKKPIQYDEDGNAILPPLELEDSIPIEVEAHDVEPEDESDEKKHTGTVVKNIYAKTGKKYKVKKK